MSERYVLLFHAYLRFSNVVPHGETNSSACSDDIHHEQPLASSTGCPILHAR